MRSRPMKRSEMKTVFIPVTLHKKLKKHAQKKNESMQHVATQALRAAIKRN